MQIVKGREQVETESHNRRPRTSLTDNISRIQKLLDDDRFLTVTEIANEFRKGYGRTGKLG